MKKIVSVILLINYLFVPIGLLSGCKHPSGGHHTISTTQPSQKNNSSEPEPTTIAEKVPYEFSKQGEYMLVKFELLPESQLLLIYFNPKTYALQFKTYDLKTNIIKYQSDVLEKEKGVSRFTFNTLRLLNRNFYILTDKNCLVFDFSCNLVQELAIPENLSGSFTPKYWLSNDLKKIAYLKKPNSEAEYLYISDSSGQNEKQIRKMEADLIDISNLFFSEKSDCLGFQGQSIPDGKDLSEDCYGYIDLSDFQTTIFVDADTFVTQQGDTLLIRDKTPLYGSPQKGIVKILYLSTKEKTELVMDIPDESDFAYLGSDPRYIVGVHGLHGDETTRTVTFTIYNEGKKMNAVEYTCISEMEYLSICSDFDVRLDVATKQLLVFYNDLEEQNYDVFSIAYYE